jgi:hypothetical protein
MRTFLLLPLLAPSVALSAQTLQIAAVAPTVVTVQVGASAQTNTLAAGPLSESQSVTASAGFPVSGNAAFSWVSAVSSGRMHFEARANMSIIAAGPASASVAPGEILVSLSLPSPTSVVLHLQKEAIGSSGAALPQMRFDVGNDGVFELTEASAGPTSIIAVVGPTPLVVRCVVSASLTGSGAIDGHISFDCVPSATRTQWVNLACSVGSYFATPRFDGNLEVLQGPLSPMVAVFGLAWQPVVLQPNCLLLPSPDFLLLLQPYAPTTLVIPAAARPVQFWTQAVEFTQGLRSTDAYRVDAL